MPEPVEEEAEEIVVTGTRIKAKSDDAVDWLMLSLATYVPSTAPDIFGQNGGGDVLQVVQFARIDGNVVVTLPGYSFTLKIPAADWDRMTPQERGEFIKMMNEFHESPMLKATFDSIEASGVSQVVVRYDSVVHTSSGGTEAWNAGQYGEVKITYGQNADGSQDTTKIVGVVININPQLVPGPDGTYDNWTNTQGETVPISFALVFAHEVRHIFYAGTGSGEEQQVRSDADQIIDDIFSTPNSSERSVQDYLEGQTFIGSMHNDNVAGSSSGDTLSGLSGSDILDGGAGNDLVMGGSGMDRLSGGTGSNLVMGGLDADTYVPVAGVTVEQLFDTGGVDRLDLSRFTLQDATFTRYDDTLVIDLYGATIETIEIKDQWLAASKVEQFTFAEGTYAASHIESLADGGMSNDVCYEDGFEVICREPYAMPVVLDLDGDGVELIDVSKSRARFDIDGDGARERIGWVGPDDGLLALDRNGNGRIDEFSEISFVQDFLGAGSDLEGLYAYDSDGDGFLTRADNGFAEFLVWRDANGNGRSERNELFTLEELGIVSIGLERSDLNPLDSDADANQIIAMSSFQTVDGRAHAVGDVALFADLGNCGCGSHSEPRPLVSDGWIP